MHRGQGGQKEGSPRRWPQACLPQLSPAWAEAVARARVRWGLATPAPLCARFAAGRPEGVGSFDLGPGKALNLLIVVVM